MMYKLQLDDEKENEIKREEKVKSFYESITQSEDLNDNLNLLCDYLQEFTGATGVYIGKLMVPMKEINEEDDDRAHLDEENPKVIRFLYASDTHEFMQEKILRSEQGISHDAFKDPEVAEEGEEENLEREDGTVAEKKEVDDILKSYRHIYVKEVVREQRMHFYKVPRLGCFMAVPLVYNSCLFEDALENSVNDFLEC